MWKSSLLLSLVSVVLPSLSCFGAEPNPAHVASEAFRVKSAQNDAKIFKSLMRLRMPHAATYFFIQAIESENEEAKREVLKYADALIETVGIDVLRPTLVFRTNFRDYDGPNRSAYLFALAKDAVLKGKYEKAIEYVNGMDAASRLWPGGLMIRATAASILGKLDEAVRGFQACQKSSGKLADWFPEQAADLENRCRAGEARAQYQKEDFGESEKSYDQIPKNSIVWPEILYEQAWNAFAKGEYNRTLGKLVSYQSPAFSFIHNPGVEVLRAQTYMALCLYGDTHAQIQAFNRIYTPLGNEIKRFVETNDKDLVAFFDAGTQALKRSQWSGNKFDAVLNRFVRGPQFQASNYAVGEIHLEFQRVKPMRTLSGDLSRFLEKVLNWRLMITKQLGGALVKNNLLDYHSNLVGSFEKMSFIKLDMLNRAKDKILRRPPQKGERARGMVEPVRRGDQMFWSFNGEFWNDEIGDYVFGLQSECSKNSAS